MRSSSLLALLIGATVALIGSCGPGDAVPGAPVVSWPANGAFHGSNRPDIIWTGDAHVAYEVHVGSHNVPASNDGWDSGVIVSSGNLAGCGSLQPGRDYFVFVRLQDADGWGPWSASGRYFHTGGQLVNEPCNVGDPVGSQWPHSICHDPDRNQYLVAFNDSKPGQTITISYHLLNGSGEKIGAGHSLTHSVLGTHAAGVAYDSVHDEYLIAYSGWQDEYTPQIHDELWVQRVRASDGTPVGSSVWIRSAPRIGDHTLPMDVGYSPASNLYCVVWHEYNGPETERVCAVRVRGGTGEVVGGVVDLGSDQMNPCENPGVIHNPANDEFFIIYQVNSYITPPYTCRDYYARRMRASDGQLLGGSILVANGPECEEQGGACYDNDMNRYLVVYQRFHDDKSIWGQFVSADGRLVSPDGTQLPAPDPFPIVDRTVTGLTCWSPQAAWDPVSREFLVTFCDMESYANYGQRLSQSGSPTGHPFSITGSVMGIGNWLPTPLWNPVSGEFIIAWYNNYDNIWTRRYRSWPVPPPDTTPPSPVSGLTAAPGDQQVTLSWTNPPDADLAGVTIRCAIGGYPNGPGDGQLVANVPGIPGAADAFTQSNLNGGVSYYYAIFARDEALNYSGSARASAVPAGPRVFSACAFNSGADGWSTSVWKSGSYDTGTIGWVPTAGNPGGGMRCTGSGASDNDFRDTREGGEMWKTIPTTHYSGIRISCDLRASSLGSAWYGTGSGGAAIPVDHNDIQEQLTVYCSTDGGDHWAELPPWLGRNALLDYLSYGTRQMDLGGLPGVDNNPAFALKFRWQLNQAADTADLDNIVISGSRMETTAPAITVTSPTVAAHCPANVTPFAVSGSASDNAGVTQVTWSNSRGGSGSCAVSPPGERSVYWDASATLQPGQNMLTFTARDLAGNARSDTMMVVYSPLSSTGIGDARNLTDNSLVYLSSVPVTAVFGDHFYVEEPGRIAGIRIKPYSTLPTVVEGATADVCGYVKTDTNGERYINGSALVVRP